MGGRYPVQRKGDVFFLPYKPINFLRRFHIHSYVIYSKFQFLIASFSLQFKCHHQYFLTFIQNSFLSQFDELKELYILKKLGGGGWCRLGETSPQRGLRAIGDVGRQGEGEYPKKRKIGETSFMDGPLQHHIFFLKVHFPFLNRRRHCRVPSNQCFLNYQQH